MWNVQVCLCSAEHWFLPSEVAGGPEALVSDVVMRASSSPSSLRATPVLLLLHQVFVPYVKLDRYQQQPRYLGGFGSEAYKNEHCKAFFRLASNAYEKEHSCTNALNGLLGTL